MSKVGKVPVKIPEGVKVTVKDATIVVEGPHGRLVQDYRPDRVEIKVADGVATVTRRQEGKNTVRFTGCTAACSRTWCTGYPRNGRSTS